MPSINYFQPRKLTPDFRIYFYNAEFIINFVLRIIFSDSNIPNDQR